MSKRKRKDLDSDQANANSGAERSESKSSALIEIPELDQPITLESDASSSVATEAQDDEDWAPAPKRQKMMKKLYKKLEAGNATREQYLEFYGPNVSCLFNLNQLI